MTTKQRNELKQAEKAYDAAADEFSRVCDLGDEAARKVAGLASIQAQANMEACLRAAGFSTCLGLPWKNGTGEMYEIKKTFIAHVTAEQTRKANRRRAILRSVDTRY